MLVREKVSHGSKVHMRPTQDRGVGIAHLDATLGVQNVELDARVGDVQPIDEFGQFFLVQALRTHRLRVGCNVVGKTMKQLLLDLLRIANALNHLERSCRAEAGNEQHREQQRQSLPQGEVA
ncbi:MAG: hypothetical protein ACKVOX_06480 [Rhizobacter sp.]